MTYDQAQSPRLGQRTSVESTYVQIFDVDPSTETADLVEAAWPGMLIYRQDRSILQIYDGEAEAWADVAGGVAGQLTYVGPEEPTGSFSVGDVWYDSDDNYRAHVWDGDSWEHTLIGARTYYETGFVPDPDWEPPPENPDETPPVVFVPLAGDFLVGDLWYQTDDGNRPFRWNGTYWEDISDPNLTQIEENSQAIAALDQELSEAGYLAMSANNTADTADGRVSMSDYLPGPDDVVYTAFKIEPDPVTGEPVEVGYEIPRVNGSIWFVRTRPRRNLCTNPSLETNTDGWSMTGGTIERMEHVYVPAGVWTLHVHASAVAEPHVVSWGEASKLPCQEGDIYTASVYAELVSGLGLGITLQLHWYDATDSFLSASIGPPIDLVLNAFDPITGGTMAEPRIWVTGAAPVGATSFCVREVSPASNASDQWHTGALLIEQEDDLGRYFDGDSYDGHWDGTAHGSASYLEGDKIQQVWELRDGDWIRKYWTTETVSSLDAGKLTGTLNGAILTESTVPPTAMAVAQVQASEALVAGDVVNVWNDHGNFRVRKASASARYEAHGFVWKAYSIGQMASVYHAGYNPFCTNLAPGQQWLSLVPGQVTNQPPSGVGQLVQQLGFAPSNTVLDFVPSLPIRII